MIHEVPGSRELSYSSTRNEIQLTVGQIEGQTIQTTALANYELKLDFQAGPWERWDEQRWFEGRRKVVLG